MTDFEKTFDNALIYPIDNDELYLIRSKIDFDVLTLAEELKYGQVISWDKKDGVSSAAL